MTFCTFHRLATVAVVIFGWVNCVASAVAVAEQKSDSRFRDVLELAGLGPEALAEFSAGPEYQDEDWRLMFQLLNRLGQYSKTQLDNWAQAWADASERQVGDLYDIAGVVQEVEPIAVPAELAEMHSCSSLYRCQFQFSNSSADDAETIGVVLSSQVPKHWVDNKVTAEPFKFRGILLKDTSGEDQTATVFLTDHLAWYPVQGVPIGQLLLARNGMDIALLDEVVQRRPFVGPEVSREGEAFYACLRALRGVDLRHLDELAQRNVANNAQRWREAHIGTKGENRADVGEDERRQRAIAAAVAEQSESGLSSVAPMFIQPEQEVGELVRIEGTARRAIRISATDQPGIEAYYELEVFTSDSQNLPIVCCVSRLPDSFPTGDEIREPVRVTGVFFKSWRYRTRQPGQGQTAGQQPLYTPLVIGKMPVWLQYSSGDESRWALWGGVGFLIALAAVWICLAMLARRDRAARSTLRPVKIDLRPDELGVEPTE